ncbi:protein kinase [Cryptosporangium sp. NPDC051539]|uniref:protein kinase domain-containing protein n=1 Tax=Cryptosporangium sp. NPDC051539 TaxID=3363962 RepID=UPI00378AFE76
MSAPGRIVDGRYRLDSVIGSGGMGVVWRGFDLRLHRPVAVKELRIPPTSTDVERAELVDRAMREARTAGKLNHPNIVAVHDVVEDHGTPFIVMPLVQGRPLFDVVNVAGPLPVALVARIGLMLLDALDAAHEAGVWHRDVKPENVMVQPDGTVLLTDFSIASVLGVGSRTLPGVVMGTPGFIAPERVLRAAAGASGDLFGLGATLYAAVEGVDAFDTTDALSGLFASATLPHREPEKAGPLGPVLDGLLAKEPDERLTSAEARDQLRPLVEGNPDASPAALATLMRANPGLTGPAATLNPTRVEPLPAGAPNALVPGAGAAAWRAGAPIPATPIPGAPAVGAPIPGAPISGAPISGVPGALGVPGGIVGPVGLGSPAAPGSPVAPASPAGPASFAAGGSPVAPGSAAAGPPGAPAGPIGAAGPFAPGVASPPRPALPPGPLPTGALPSGPPPRGTAGGGAPWGAPEGPPPPGPLTRYRRYLIPGAAAAVILLLAIIVGIVLTNGNGEPGTHDSPTPLAQGSTPKTSAPPSASPSFVVGSGDDKPTGAEFLNAHKGDDDASVSRGRAQINGTEYNESVRIKPACTTYDGEARDAAWADFEIPGSYRSLQAYVGLDDRADDSGIGSLHYIVTVDGNQVAEDTLYAGAPKQLMISLPAGASTVRLAVSASSDYYCEDGGTDAAIAWGNAILVP